MFLIHPVFCYRCFEYRFRNILSRSTEQHRAKKEVEIAVDCRRKTVVNQASEYLGAEKCTFLSYLFLQYKLVSHINVQYSKKRIKLSCSGLRKEARHPRAARREGIAFDSQAIETQIQSNRYALLTLGACINFESTSDCFVCTVR